VSARFKFIDNVEVEFHRLWSIRISLFVGVLTGLCAVISAFTDVFNPWLLLSISIVANVALIPLSRLIKQDDAK
jgi:quinol-cytochrome oxidoreductase complex cytochrome b subunit